MASHPQASVSVAASLNPAFPHSPLPVSDGPCTLRRPNSPSRSWIRIPMAVALPRVGPCRGDREGRNYGYLCTWTHVPAHQHVQCLLCGYVLPAEFYNWYLRCVEDDGSWGMDIDPGHVADAIREHGDMVEYNYSQNLVSRGTRTHRQHEGSTLTVTRPPSAQVRHGDRQQRSHTRPPSYNQGCAESRARNRRSRSTRPGHQLTEPGPSNMPSDGPIQGTIAAAPAVGGMPTGWAHPSSSLSGAPPNDKEPRPGANPHRPKHTPGPATAVRGWSAGWTADLPKGSHRVVVLDDTKRRARARKGQAVRPSAEPVGIIEEQEVYSSR